MSEFILRFSGMFAMLFAWVFVVTPALRCGIDSKRHTISSAAKKNKSAGKLITTGLITGSLFQIVFLQYLIQKYQLNIFDAGCLLYLSTNGATILVALFPEHTHFKIHSFCTKYYFLMYPISLLTMGKSLPYEHLNIFIFTSLTVFIYFAGVLWIIKKYGITAKVEQYAFLTLSLWTIVLTLV